MADIAGLEQEVQARRAKAAGLSEGLQGKARLEDLTGCKRSPWSSRPRKARGSITGERHLGEMERRLRSILGLQEDEPGRKLAEGKEAKGF